MKTRGEYGPWTLDSAWIVNQPGPGNGVERFKATSRAGPRRHRLRRLKRIPRSMTLPAEPASDGRLAQDGLVPSPTSDHLIGDAVEIIPDETVRTVDPGQVFGDPLRGVARRTNVEAPDGGVATAGDLHVAIDPAKLGFLFPYRRVEFYHVRPVFYVVVVH